MRKKQAAPYGRLCACLGLGDGLAGLETSLEELSVSKLLQITIPEDTGVEPCLEAHFPHTCFLNRITLKRSKSLSCFLRACLSNFFA